MQLIKLSQETHDKIFTIKGLNLPDNLPQDSWLYIHNYILICKKAASKWLHQSRDFSNARWGMEFTAQAEAQLELDLGLSLPEAKPALNPADKTKAIVTIEGLSQSFILWQRKMSDEIQQWDKDKLTRALDLLEPMEREAKRVRELLGKV